MPDGSNMQTVASSTRFPAAPKQIGVPRHSSMPFREKNAHGFFLCVDPVMAGLVSNKELQAMRRYVRARAAFSKNHRFVVGMAEPAALYAGATLHYSDPVQGRVYRDSIRHTWLMAHLEMNWIRWRADKRLRARERLAASVQAAACALLNANTYKPYSRHALHLAEWLRDHRGVAEINKRRANYADRRAALLAWRKKRRSLLRKLLSLVSAYRAALSADTAP